MKVGDTFREVGDEGEPWTVEAFGQTGAGARAVTLVRGDVRVVRYESELMDRSKWEPERARALC